MNSKFRRLTKDLQRTILQALLSLCTLLFLSPASADEVELLLDRLAACNDYQASFKQHLYAADGELLQQGEGQVVIQRPRNLRWDIVRPLQQTLIVRGDRYYQYDRDLEQLIDQPLSDRNAGLLRSLLAGDSGEVRRHYRVLRLEADEGAIVEGAAKDTAAMRFRVFPRRDNSLFVSATLTFLQQQLQSIVVVDDFDQNSHFEFYDIAVNALLDAAHFEIDVPAGTDILRY